MNKNWLIAVVIAIVVIGGIVVLSKQTDAPANVTQNENVATPPPVANPPPPASTSITPPPGGTTPPPVTPPPATPPPVTPPPVTPPPTPIIKSFTITGSNFKFSPSSMEVKKGDTVRITFINQAGTHDFKIDGYNVATKIIQGGEQETIQFVATQAGSFEYYCSVGTHRQMGMKGTLVVQ